jgi:hypothetical protein
MAISKSRAPKTQLRIPRRHRRLPRGGAKPNTLAQAEENEELATSLRARSRCRGELPLREAVDDTSSRPVGLRVTPVSDGSFITTGFRPQKKESSDSRCNQLSCVRSPVLFLGAFLCAAAAAHITAPATAATAQPQASAPVDAPDRSSPHSTVLNLLKVACNTDCAAAARYLHTRLTGDAAAYLARQLYVVLDQRLPVRVRFLRLSAPDSIPGSHLRWTYTAS